jgi:hypothetical protein
MAGRDIDLPSPAGPLEAVVRSAVEGESEWDARLAAGLGAGLRFLASDPALARLLLVDWPAATAGPERLAHERMLERLAEGLRAAAPVGSPARISTEMARLLAGGLVSSASGRVVAGEAARLSGDHDHLLCFLRAPFEAASASLCGAGRS